MIDKIGSCVALNFELGQTSLQINFRSFGIMTQSLMIIPGIYENSATYISHRDEIQPLLTMNLAEFHCLQFRKLHFGNKIFTSDIDCTSGL